MVSSDGQNNRLVNSFDFFVAGSDQVWNPLFDFIGDREFLTFAKPEQRIAYAASIGLNQLPSQYHDVFLKRLDGFKAIAMRESSGTKIVQDLTDRNDIVTVLDPTMLLSREQWHSVARKSKYQPTRPYIFKYILGVDNPELDQEIEIKAKELKFAIFELHDFSKSDTRAIGPAEFISLIENSEMVFTDSFHGTVFSLLFHRLFFTVQRPYQEGFGEMSSRLETLLDMVEMRERLVDSVDQYKKVDLLCDFRKADKVLEERKALSKRFLRNAFGGDEENYNEN